MGAFAKVPIDPEKLEKFFDLTNTEKPKSFDLGFLYGANPDGLHWLYWCSR